MLSMKPNKYPCSECGSRTVNPFCVSCTYHPNNPEPENETMNSELHKAIRRDTREAREWSDNRDTETLRRDLSLLGVRVLDEDNPNRSRSYAGAVSVIVLILGLIALIVTLTK